VCDEVRLQRVFENFLAHALEFAPEHSTITIGARREGGEMRFWVANEGPGIPLARQRELFAGKNSTTSPFNRVDDKNESGLAMCQRIVTAHGGVIQAHNRPEGGTCFEFCLSAAVDCPPTQPSDFPARVVNFPAELAVA
jgi:signal transduction histidine kinase